MTGCSTCKKEPSQTHDKYSGCAPIMSDGRLFTNWTPRCTQAYHDIQQKTLMSSYESRQELITKATQYMKQNAADAYLAARCGPCYENPDWNSGTMLPELNMQVCNERTCSFSPNNPSGLGLGRQYWNPAMDSQYRQRFLAEKEKEQAFFKSKYASLQPYNAE